MIMETSIEIIFWICIAIVFYTYIGYGILLYVIIKLKRIFRSPKTTCNLTDDDIPEMTLMICAYNEEDIIKQKMHNCDALTYPEGKLKIMWVTDGSDDNSNSILSNYPEVILITKTGREGKTAAINHGMQYVKTPLVAFTDANTMLNYDAMIEIAKCFNDKTVGCVSGEKRVLAHGYDDTAGNGEGAYWKYESTLKKWDFELYSTMGAAGELFAIRTELYENMPNDTLLDDFIVSMRIVQKGWRIAYTDKAYAIEYGSANTKEESKRKRRISAGGLQSISRLTELLNPIHHPIVTFQYISHRVLRWSVTPFTLFALIPLNIMLSIVNAGNIYNIILILQIIFYVSAMSGLLLTTSGHKSKILYIPYYFLFMNVNVFRGIYYLKKKKGSGAWEKAKRG